LGLRSGEAVGRKVFEMYADHQGIIDAHRRALQGESVLDTVEVQGLVFESRIMPLRDADGKITGILGVATDITERRRAEQSSKQSEARLSAIIANTPTVAIEGYDIDGRVLFWNEAAQRMFGWGAVEAVGKKLDELMLSPMAARDFEGLLQQVQRTGQPMPREWAYTNRRGDRGVCYSTVFIVPSESGVDTFICMDIDITQRRRAEESLHQSEERLRSIFESAIDPLWDWDVVTNRTLHSPSWAKLLGYEVHELDESMQEWESRVHPDDQSRVWEELRACLEGKRSEYEAVYRLRIRNGDWKWALSRGRVVERDSRGKALRMIGSITDITERKQAEEALRKSSNFQRLLLSELDHRVRNNLASLSALIDISARSQTTVRDMARSIQGRVQAMATVHGLLSRGHFRTVGLDNLIKAIIPEDLHTRLDVEGPEVLLPPRQVTAMGMVIQELTANSLKYGALASTEGRIRVHWTNRPSHDQRHMVVELDWHERGGEPIATSEGRGREPRVGTALVQGLVRAELRGEAVLSYPPHGATHRFIFLIEGAE
jgi:PAS domain S-box-containing protein